MSIPFRSPIDLGLNQLLSALAESVTSDPGTATLGRLIYRSDIHVFKVGNGTTWDSFYLSSVRLDQITAPTAPLSLNSQRITSLADPSGAQDAATRNYVDTQINLNIQGLDAKGSVKAATTAALPTNTATATTLTASANAALAAQDGITLVVADRLLVKNEAAPQNNGIYTVTQVGSGAAPFILTRAVDMDAWSEVPSAYTWVEQGTVNADTGWTATADQGGTLGTTGIPWVKFSAAATTLTKASGTITGDGSTTTFTATHNLASLMHQTWVWKVSNNEWEPVEITRGSNADSIVFGSAPANTEAFDWVVIG